MKNCCFCCLIFTYVLLDDFYLFCVYCVAKFFLKKVNRQISCPDSLIYYTIDVCFPEIHYRELFFTNLAPIFLTHLLIFICVYLLLLVRTSFYLSQPILICQNLFLFVKTYLHLCSLIFSVKISSCS